MDIKFLLFVTFPVRTNDQMFAYLNVFYFEQPSFWAILGPP